MTYPPQPHSSPDPSQPPSGSQHYTTDPYHPQQPHYPNSAGGHGVTSPAGGYAPSPMGGAPGGPPGGPPQGPYQYSAPSGPPPGNNSSIGLVLTLGVIALTVIVGGIVTMVALNASDDNDTATDDPSTSTDDESPETDPSSEEPDPTPSAQVSEDDEPDIEVRLPRVDECITDSIETIEVIDCDHPDAAFIIVKRVDDPEDPDPSDSTHYEAAVEACSDTDWADYVYQDTSLASGEEWDPDEHQLLRILCAEYND